MSPMPDGKYRIITTRLLSYVHPIAWIALAAFSICCISVMSKH